MIDSTFIQEIVAQARRPRVKTIHGREVLLVPTKDGEYQAIELPTPPHLPEPLVVHSVASVIEFVKENRDKMPIESVSVHVKSPELIEVVGPLDSFAKRAVYCKALFASPFKDQNVNFAFGKTMDLEQAIIALQVLFGPTTGREDLLKVIGNVTDSNVKKFEDDGVTQQVIAQKGVAMRQDVKVPNPVMLCPFRTFREVKQPESPFVVRVAPGRDGQMPTVALFECDGGQWRIEAVTTIKELLANELEMLVSIVG